MAVRKAPKRNTTKAKARKRFIALRDACDNVVDPYGAVVYNVKNAKQKIVEENYADEGETFTVYELVPVTRYQVPDFSNLNEIAL